MMTSAGWQDIHFEPFDFAMIVGAGADPVEEAVAYYTSIGPAARVMRQLDSDAQARLTESLRNFAKSHVDGGIVALRAGVWLVSARKA